ncbi:hypothetical protein [Alkalihalobacillus sp. BA299]|uniref:hypothetical protein n=1 Tax=Alkalihalobacillus sp. BA299 TaxID=2815938 RepID=UPI001AD9F061|nr:hypothetical protein [Alkalihalobacillus sp. BA299]
MGTSLATFMKIAVTVIVISAILFSVGYQMIEDESNSYDQEIIDYKNDALNP